MNGAHPRLVRMARLMVALEWHAHVAEQAGDEERAETLWARRADVQLRRSVRMRQRWAEQRERYG